jgi:predicted ATPase
MELVYLWVDSYKNIEKQGFNFSPRFKCDFFPEYDENKKLKNNCKLEIKPKEYTNIFPDNINITAIVGENGSGKSRILECIEKIILADNGQKLDEFKYILVYQNEVPLYISNIEINTSIEREIVFADICSLVYKYYVSKKQINEARYYSSANLHYFTLEKQGIVNILSAKQDKMNSFHISSFMYEPIKAEITLKSYDTLIQEHLAFLDFKKRDEIDQISKTIIDLYHQYLSILYIRQKGLAIDFEIIKNKEYLKENTNNPLSEKKFNIFFNDVITMKEYTIAKISQEQKDIYFHKDYWHYFEFDFIDEKERRYNHLSHGEKVIFSQLLSIFFYINTNEKLLFLFDEPEIALHPNWQKKYLNEVINLLQKIPKKYHFIFATHSSFLLSDLAKENVIFLEKYKKDEDKNQKEGNCKIVIPDIKQTFGANIHTLLSHGFFMNSSLMGEFAKSKITEIIEILKKEQLSEDEIKTCKHIISIIGEPILQKTLEHQLNKKLNPNETELQKLEREQKEIENKIKKLKGNQ